MSGEGAAPIKSRPGFVRGSVPLRADGFHHCTWGDPLVPSGTGAR
jgi:hypothetical protein